jgi:hypothetical protein
MERSFIRVERVEHVEWGSGKKTGGWLLHGRFAAVEMSGERNGECDYIRNV